jgi:hypothetical protein
MSASQRIQKAIELSELARLVRDAGAERRPQNSR